MKDFRFTSSTDRFFLHTTKVRNCLELSVIFLVFFYFYATSSQPSAKLEKELCELAGIDTPVHLTYYRGQQRIDETLPKYELIGTHAGRRTFICNAILLGIPANVIMKWTGHSDYKAMKPYVDVADETKASAMSKFNLI